MHLAAPVSGAIALHHLSQQALAGLDFPTLLQQTAQTVAQVLQVQICAIWEILPDRQTLKCLTTVGSNTAPGKVGTTAHLTVEPTAWFDRANATAIYLSCALRHEADQRLIPTDAAVPTEHLTVQINGIGSVFGLLELETATPRILTAADQSFLQAITQFIHTAIQRNQADQLLQLRSIHLEKIANNQALDDIFRQLCQAIETHIPGALCAIVQLDEASQQVTAEVSPSLSPHQAEPDTYPVEVLPTIYQAVLQQATTKIWNASPVTNSQDEVWLNYATANQIQTAWIVPFCNQAAADQVYGFLTIAYRMHAVLQPQQQQLIETIAHLATIATENHRNAHKLEKQAMYDGLTGLPNRSFFMQQLSQKLQARQEPFALLFLDVDHFKLVNDSLGHNAGDALLSEITRRLTPCIRRSDVFARLGGDEFAIMLNGVLNVGQAQSIADQIKAVLSLPFKIIDREVFASVSIGIAHSDNYYASPAEILRDADIAMYRAKSLGRSRAATFDKTMHANVVDRMQMEMELRRIVDQIFLDGSSQLQLYYQPIVSLKTGRVAGFEALIRWIHPERGIISPLDFIPVAEEIGLIIPIGQWVIQEACQQLSRWQTELNVPDLSMSINVSSRQFLQADFLPMVQQILEYTGISPDCLKLEITESVLMETASTGLRATGIPAGFGGSTQPRRLWHRLLLPQLPAAVPHQYSQGRSFLH
ncbi:MAG: diguanylate cyclase [Alkalinema sp. RL_2_19]|nr:diguanylate cyclase [Alkalinema sp. RL_2_19]